MRELSVIKAIDRLESMESLDPLTNTVGSVVQSVVRAQWLRDLLHGVPFGHPLHPTLVQVPIGAWLSAGILDAMPGTARAARALVGIGALSALPAAVAGANDLTRFDPRQARIGIVHATANVVAVLLYSGSYLQRRGGGSGKLLGYLGLAVISGSGFLGGHLSFRLAAGTNRAAGVPSRFPPGWQALVPITDLPDGQLAGRELAGQPLVLLRRGESVAALSAVCSHLSGPLAEGELLGGGTDHPCVKCPWHGSVFAMNTGEVVHGPATAPAPTFETRINHGKVEVRMPGAG